MERADERRQLARTLDQLHAAVKAGVDEGLDRTVLLPGHDPRTIADLVGDIVAGCRDVAFVAGHLPGARPHALHFELVEFSRDIARDRHVIDAQVELGAARISRWRLA